MNCGCGYCSCSQSQNLRYSLVFWDLAVALAGPLSGPLTGSISGPLSDPLAGPLAGSPTGPAYMFYGGKISVSYPNLKIWLRAFCLTLEPVAPRSERALLKS